MDGSWFLDDVSSCAYSQGFCAAKAGTSKPEALGFEAAFGPLRAARKSRNKEGPEQPEDRLPGGAQDQVSVQDLWDAPSHVLPPLSVMAGPSLEAMLAGLAH